MGTDSTRDAFTVSAIPCGATPCGGIPRGGIPRGATLVELVLVLGLFSLVLGGLARFAAGHGRIARTQLEATRFAEAVRASRVILQGEVRAVSGHDITAIGPDSMRLRAFRGGGAVCSVEGARLGVLYRGHRLPDPAKDSVVVITALGEQYRAVAQVGGAVCGGEGLLLVLDAPIASDPLFALGFETGAYHLADGALRYRRGQSGRQPLVEAILRTSDFRLPAGAIAFDVAPSPDSLPTMAGGASVTATLLNTGPP